MENEREIRQIVDHAQDAWNRGDSAAIASLFAKDAEFVDILGRYHRGRPVIEAGHREIFDTIYKDSRQEYKLHSLRFVRPDVAVVFLHARLQSYLAPAAIDAADRASNIDNKLHEATARPTLVLAKNGGQWEIVAFQNTKEACDWLHREHGASPPAQRAGNRPAVPQGVGCDRINAQS